MVTDTVQGDGIKWRGKSAQQGEDYLHERKPNYGRPTVAEWGEGGRGGAGEKTLKRSEKMFDNGQLSTAEIEALGWLSCNGRIFAAS
jgi:hypothetical protein